MRPDIDPAAVGNGIVALMLSVLMSVTQLGSQAAVAYSHDVAAVFEAALRLRPPRRRRADPAGARAVRRPGQRRFGPADS